MNKQARLFHSNLSPGRFKSKCDCGKHLQFQNQVDFIPNIISSKYNYMDK